MTEDLKWSSYDFTKIPFDDIVQVGQRTLLYRDILIYFLTRIGLVTPEILKRYRKFAIVIIFIISAVITPPDVASQVIVSIPVLILYEFSIFISRIVIRKQKSNG